MERLEASQRAPDTKRLEFGIKGKRLNLHRPELADRRGGCEQDVAPRLESGVLTEARVGKHLGCNGLGTQACAAGVISTPSTMATMKSAGTSPNKWPRSAASPSD
jgi:hypothetical protein